MEVSDPALAPVRGLLMQHHSMENFDLVRIAPSPALGGFVENYWLILWDLNGQDDYIQENLAHPSINLVVDPHGQTGLFGVQTKKFTYVLSGAGSLFGVKFWPGAFHDFYHKPVDGLKNTFVPVQDIFRIKDDELEHNFSRTKDPRDFAEKVEKLLLIDNPTLSENAKKARQLVEMIAGSCEITSVHDLSKISGYGMRKLQRLFAQYVGVGPKWVIERYRMLAALDMLNRGERVDFTELAHNLGYFDQAHFGRVFRSLTGKSPSAYDHVHNN